MKNYIIPSLIIGVAIIISSVIIAGALDETFKITGSGYKTGYRLNTKTGEVVHLFENKAMLTRAFEGEEPAEGFLPAKIEPRVMESTE